MSHFYGGIDGNRGPATRMGSKDSGFQAYAQGYNSRITVRYYHADRYLSEGDEPHDTASISLGGGYSTYYTGKGLNFEHVDDIAHALDFDEKSQAIWKRMQADLAKLDARAVVAVRAKRKRDAAARKRAQRESARAAAQERARRAREIAGLERALESS